MIYAIGHSHSQVKLSSFFARKVGSLKIDYVLLEERMFFRENQGLVCGIVVGLRIYSCSYRYYYRVL